ncbi:MAG TPA: DUF481 domain-containing protein, partial [Gemmatimonadales bacterium]|nr:DUF481 domain-containing protein [Gemmatimonadales bacterium]
MTRLWKLAVVLCVLVASVGRVLSAQIDLTNGDRLTARVVRSDASGVTVTSAPMGDVTVPWAGITAITSDSALFVVTASHGTITGPVTTEGGDLVVATTQGAIRVPLASKPVLRSPAEQAAFEHAQHPGLLENIRGGVTFGLTVAQGNSETTNLSIGLTALRTTLHTRAAINFTSVYASDKGEPTANDWRAGLRYDRDFLARWFGFLAADYEHNELQLLDLRQVYTAGVGFHAITGDTTTLNLLAGFNYTKEVYSPAPTNNVTGATLGQDFLHKFAANTTLIEQFFLYPDLEDLGEYRAAFDLRFATKLKGWLGLQVTVSDRFTSTPPAGTKENDLIFTTGLN